MAVDRLKDICDFYDVIVIGSGLGGLTAANHLAKQGHSVILFEHHYQYGGLATWFRRKHNNIFDISLHGFPAGMIKSCRRYWTPEIANSIVQLKGIRFRNPDFSIDTTFDYSDFTNHLTFHFKIPKSQVEAFFLHLSQMNFYDNDQRTIADLFQEFFPDRPDVHRFLLEPISFANGSSLEDPAIAYGIVFLNFMHKGVFIYQGGTDTLIRKMIDESNKNGVVTRKFCKVEKIITESTNSSQPRVLGVIVNGREIHSNAVISNASLKNTIFNLLGSENLPTDFAQKAQDVRLNNSACQVYIGITAGESIPNIGDIIFTSDAKPFSSSELTDLHTTSRAFSVYYPNTRPHNKEDRYAIVASLNAKWADWADLSDSDYQSHKDRLCQEALTALEPYIPDIRSKVNLLEAATPKTVNRFTTHMNGATFGTKFEGLQVSMDLPDQISGLFHSSSVGIIMSGWLGTINYGIINANKTDQFLSNLKKHCY